MSKESLIYKSKKKKKATMENRRRSGFVLTRQRDLVPIALGAAVAAISLHVVMFMYAPSLLAFTPKERPVEQKASDEIINISIQDIPEKEYVKAKDEPKEITEAKELEEAIREPQEAEIDILDYKVEELTLAPGETDLGVPEPVSANEDDPSAITEMPATDLDASTLQSVNVPEEVLQVAEPRPVYDSDLIVKAVGELEVLPDANADRNKDLQEGASGGEDGMPSDTRSLMDLLGASNLGSESGVARLGADLLFKFNECRLTTSARFSMLQLAALIQKNPETDFVIEGHTDSIGDADYNALLSLQRAAAVCEWLQKNNVPMVRVHIRACGNKAPLADVHGTKEQQSKNRRVEIHMRRKGEPLPEGCFPANYPVDLDTPTRTQLTNGVRVPDVYTPSGTSVATDGAPKPATTTQPKTTAKPTPAADKGKGKPAAKPDPKKGKNNGKKPDAKKNGKKK